MAAIVVHGGAGRTSSVAERGCVRAAELGMEILQQGGSALDAVVAAVVWMENSGKYNAGIGSVVRFDGTTIQMDAVVATSDGLQGAVEAVEDVKNPVLLAVEVLRTPHMTLAGHGATDFARRVGLSAHPGPSRLALQRHQRLLNAIARGEINIAAPGWTPEALAEFLGEQEQNGDGAFPLPVQDCDTVGAIALDTEGKFAVAASTGGMSIMLRGRVGDVPERGAGFQVGPFGGALATGIGEEIKRQRGSDKVYQLIQVGLGLHPQQACEQIVGLFDPSIPVGFIALTTKGVGIASNRRMPSYSIVE